MGALLCGAGVHISPSRWHLQLLYPSFWAPRGDGQLKYILTSHKLQAFYISLLSTTFWLNCDVVRLGRSDGRFTVKLISAVIPFRDNALTRSETISYATSAIRTSSLTLVFVQLLPKPLIIVSHATLLGYTKSLVHTMKQVCIKQPLASYHCTAEKRDLNDRAAWVT